MVPIYEIEENLETGPVMNPGVVPSLNPDSSITETIEAFLAARIPNGKTARGYRRNLLAAFGSMCIERPSEIQTLHLVNWLGELNRDGRGDSSHAAALIAVRSFLKWAGAMGGHDIRNDLVQYLLPVPNVQVLKPHNSLTEKEVGKFLAAGKRGGPRDFALICVALGAGLRVSELVAVDVKDILDDAGGGTVIHVRLCQLPLQPQHRGRPASPGPRHGRHHHALRRSPRQAPVTIRHPGFSRWWQGSARQTLGQKVSPVTLATAFLTHQKLSIFASNDIPSSSGCIGH